MIQLYKHSEEQYLPGNNHAQTDRLRQTDTNRPYRYRAVGNVRASKKQNAKNIGGSNATIALHSKKGKE